MTETTRLPEPTDIRGNSNLSNDTVSYTKLERYIHGLLRVLRFNFININTQIEGYQNEGLVTESDLEVKGDTNGLILESPNGTRWRITIDNSGTLITTSL